MRKSFCGRPESEHAPIERFARNDEYDLTDAERQALHARMARSWEAAKTGYVRDAREVIDDIRKRG